MTPSLWVRPICDNLLAKVQAWLKAWPYGAVAATRPYLHKSGQVEDIVTMRAVSIAWDLKEFEMLVHILKTVRPEWEFTVDLDQFRSTQLPRARMIPGGKRLTTMAVYQKQLEETVELLENVKNNRQSAVKEIEGGTFWDQVSE